MGKIKKEDLYNEHIRDVNTKIDLDNLGIPKNIKDAFINAMYGGVHGPLVGFNKELGWFYGEAHFSGGLDFYLSERKGKLTNTTDYVLFDDGELSTKELVLQWLKQMLRKL